LDELRPSKRAFNAPLKISIFQSCHITGIGTVLEGQILSGKLNKEIDLCIPLYDKITKSKCYSKQIHDNKYNEAFIGDIIDFNIKGKKENVACYFNLVFNESSMTNISADNLRVKILMINKNTKLRIGSTLTLFCYNLYVPIKIIKIEYLVDEENKIFEKERKEIKNGERAFIIINIIKKKIKFYSKYYGMKST